MNTSSSRRHITRAAATFVAVVAGSAAFAQAVCPTRADLATGVRLTRPDPYLTMLYRTTGTDLWEMRTEGNDEAGPRTMYPHALAVGLRESDGVTLEITYDDDPAALHQLDVTQTWGTDITLRRDGEVVVAGYFSATFLGAADIDVGGCTYAAWNTRDILALGDGDPIIFEKYYAPSLGLVLRAARIDVDGSGMSTVIMTEIALEND